MALGDSLPQINLQGEKTERRTTMEKEMFNSLMLLRTQNDFTIDIDYNDVFYDFDMLKAQKKHLLFLLTLERIRLSKSKR
ncbi:hypothetical protein TNCV_4152661 [Trichonephila clavipes]|nr:hypothetical protein TNCV_4152661 [Trichonephila clavipes]